MLALPPALLDLLQLKAGTAVGVGVDGGRLFVEPRIRPRFSLDQLLSQCDASAPLPDEDRKWLDAPSHGNELF